MHDTYIKFFVSEMLIYTESNQVHLLKYSTLLELFTQHLFDNTFQIHIFNI